MSSPSTTSSSSSSSSSDGNGDDNGGGYGYGGARGEFEGPSRSRPRGGPVNEVWPEPFLEALALHVVIDASRFSGRLAAAQALSNVFQVCSTWRAVSRSELLWRQLTQHVWGRFELLQDSWREEYIYRHHIVRNFMMGRCRYDTLFFDRSNVEDPDALLCRCLAVSDHYLACGFNDGAVRLFDLSTRQHVQTFRPQPREERLGRFSRAVSGIVMTDSRLVFATLDGDVHMARTNAGSRTRRAHSGDVVNDGALIDFTGSERWWVGLYAGAPGQAFRIWDSQTEVLTFMGGTLTDPDAVMGWHTLAEPTEPIGRVRLTRHETAIATTTTRQLVFSLRDQGVILNDTQHRRGAIVRAFDVTRHAYLIVDIGGTANVRHTDTLELACPRFNAGRGVMGGCANQGFVIMWCGGGVMRVWEVEQRGQYLYALRDRVGGELNAMVANETHVAAAGSDTMIHLWDFGGQLPP